MGTIAMTVRAGDTGTISILQTEKVRLREAKEFTQDRVN